MTIIDRLISEGEISVFINHYYGHVFVTVTMTTKLPKPEKSKYLNQKHNVSNQVLL